MRKIKKNPNNEELAIKMNEIIDFLKRQSYPPLNTKISIRDIDGFIDPVTGD